MLDMFLQSTLRLWMYCKVVHFILNQSHCANLKNKQNNTSFATYKKI